MSKPVKKTTKKTTARTVEPAAGVRANFADGMRYIAAAVADLLETDPIASIQVATLIKQAETVGRVPRRIHHPSHVGGVLWFERYEKFLTRLERSGTIPAYTPPPAHRPRNDDVLEV